MCITSANVISPCNHIISEFVSARKQGNQSLVRLQNPYVHIQKGIFNAKKSWKQLFYLSLPLLFEWRINLFLILYMDTLPVLLGNLLKEIPPTYHIVLQDESWALQCHRRKTNTFARNCPGWTDRPFRSVMLWSCNNDVYFHRHSGGVMTPIHSSSVSEFILRLQPLPSVLPSSLASSNFQNPTACFLTGVSMTTSVWGSVDSRTPFHLSFVTLSSSFLNNSGSSLFLCCAFWPRFSEFSVHINEFCSEIQNQSHSFKPTPSQRTGSDQVCPAL